MPFPPSSRACRTWRPTSHRSCRALARTTAYQARRLGTPDSIHLATAEPFRVGLTAFVTYDGELARAATDFGLPVHAPA